MHSIEITAAPGFRAGVGTRPARDAAVSVGHGLRGAWLRLLSRDRGTIVGTTRTGAPHRDLPLPFC